MSNRPFYIFIRHYREDLYSSGSRDPFKVRPRWYSSNRCILSLLESVKVNPTVSARVSLFFDGPESEVLSDEFLSSILGQSQPSTRILTLRNEGTKPLGDLASFRELIRFVCTDETIPSNAVIYVCENDYLHHSKAVNAISNFFCGVAGRWAESANEAGVELSDYSGLVIGDYLSLYDNPDYYRLTYHQKGSRRVAARGGFLYRQEKTLTASFASLKETLTSDLGTFLWKTDDFDFFSRLGLKGRSLYVTCPAYATHAMQGMTAPGVDWQAIANDLENS